MDYKPYFAIQIEKWAAVPGHGMFEASSLGRVRTQDRQVTFMRNGKPKTCQLKGKVLSPWVGNNGYRHVSHKADGARRKFLVHRLVAMAFVAGFKPGLSVNHINGIKTDNRADNLEWCTLAENTAHQWRIGISVPRGEKNPCAKLSDAQVLEIRASTGTLESVAAKYGVSGSLVCCIRSGKRRRFIGAS